MTNEEITAIAKSVGFEEHNGVIATVSFWIDKKILAFTDKIRRKQLDDIAQWYEETGYLLDESDVPKAIRDFINQP